VAAPQAAALAGVRAKDTAPGCLHGGSDGCGRHCARAASGRALASHRGCLQQRRSAGRCVQVRGPALSTANASATPPQSKHPYARVAQHLLSVQAFQSSCLAPPCSQQDQEAPCPLRPLLAHVRSNASTTPCSRRALLATHPAQARGQDRHAGAAAARPSGPAAVLRAARGRRAARQAQAAQARVRAPHAGVRSASCSRAPQRRRTGESRSKCAPASLLPSL